MPTEVNLGWHSPWEDAGEQGKRTGAQELVLGALAERKAQETVFFPRDKCLLRSLPDVHVCGHSRKH